jgi:hypothetical protein
MPIINETMSWLMKRRLPRIQVQRNEPMRVQMEVFHDLIAKAKHTEWGKTHGFSTITTVQQFQERVPINNYEGLFPWIERVMRGEQNVLWPSQIQWFSKSSGTTNARSKYIPVSKESLEECHYMGGKDMITLYLENVENTKIFDGKGVSIGGSLGSNPITDYGQAGDVSAVIMKNLPVWAQLIRTPNLEVALMSEWEDKINKMAAITSTENVTSILGVPTWTMVLLDKVKEMTGLRSIIEIWPNFEVFFHGAIAFAPYRNLFKHQIFAGAETRFFEIYNASEGFFGLQDDLSKPDEMMLMLDYGVFYEFMPIDAAGNETGLAETADSVEIGKNYALLISTNAGLWRYKIGDTVRVTNKYPLRIKISGRTKQFINAFGEELMVENADAALAEVCAQHNCHVLEYTAGPIFMADGAKGGHEWVMEFDQAPNNLAEFSADLDTALRSLNSDYDAKRYQNMVLQPLTLHVANKGTFYEWMKQRGKLGGQHKVPRLANGRDYLDEILPLLESQKKSIS